MMLQHRQGHGLFSGSTDNATLAIQKKKKKKIDIQVVEPSQENI